MDILNPEVWRQDYMNFMYSMLEKDWTIKLHHSDYITTSHKISPFAFARFDFKPVIIEKEKRLCTIQFTLDETVFTVEIFTPISISFQEFLVRTYNKLADIIKTDLPMESYKKFNNIIKLELKHLNGFNV